MGWRSGLRLTSEYALAAPDSLCCAAQLGLNRFADMTEAEFRAAYLGYSSRRNPLLTCARYCAACCMPHAMHLDYITNADGGLLVDFSNS